jgi:hypothetical protein
MRPLLPRDAPGPKPAPPPPPPPSQDPAADLRDLLAARIGELVANQRDGGFTDVNELVKLTNALKSLDDTPPKEHEREEIDLTGVSDEALDELLAATERGKWSPERREAYQREQTAKNEERERIYQRGLRCTCQP